MKEKRFRDMHTKRADRRVNHDGCGLLRKEYGWKRGSYQHTDIRMRGALIGIPSL